MTVLKHIVASVFLSIGVAHHLEYAMSGLKYLSFATNSLESINFPWMVLIYLKVYSEDVDSTCNSHVSDNQQRWWHQLTQLKYFDLWYLQNHIIYFCGLIPVHIHI